LRDGGKPLPSAQVMAGFWLAREVGAHYVGGRVAQGLRLIADHVAGRDILPITSDC
jgi:hypothetical protein